jgi:dTDP-4-amino-4,6-dideoxygalactose transaminase
MIPYGRQSIDESDIDAVVSALKSDWLTTGPQIELFESIFEKVVGAPSITVSSGTAALHCAYSAIGLEPGDEIITPPITFIATQATAALLGASIVFADVHPKTATIDPEAVAAAVTNRTRAIVAVDYAGRPAQLDELRLIADKYNLVLIEDAAHSLGSTYKNKPVGSIADLTTFSFFPTKNITTFEGGAISSKDSDLLRKAKEFSRQGLVRDESRFVMSGEGGWHQEVHQFGLNYRLSDVQCALGVSQLKRINSFKLKRQRIFDIYTSELADSELYGTPHMDDTSEPNWHLYSIKVPKSIRRNLYDFLRTEGIGVQVNYLPAHLHPIFQDKGYKRGDFPASESFYDSQLSLPMHVNITDGDLEYVIGKMKEFEKKQF